MSRVKKLPEERRAEIVDAARRLFSEKGVEKISVSDIVKEVGVAQGTFYWYFSSKDDVVNEVARQSADEMMRDLEAIDNDPRLDATAKLKQMMIRSLSVSQKDVELMIHFHRPEHTRIHDQICQEVIKRLTPILRDIIDQGIREGVFNTRYPDEVAVFISRALQGDDREILSETWDADRVKKSVAAFMDFITKGLRSDPNP